jgi:hypothetical protein
MSCGKKTLAVPNQFESSLLLGYGDSTLWPYIVVNQWNMVTYENEIKWDEMVYEVLDLEQCKLDTNNNLIQS